MRKNFGDRIIACILSATLLSSFFLAYPGATYFAIIFLALTSGFILALAFYLSSGRGLQAKSSLEINADKIAWIFILIGFLLRICWSQFSGVEQTSDFAQYASMAEEIYKGDYLLTPRKQSGPALVGACIYWLTNGINLSHVLLFQAIISGMTLPLVYFSVKKLFGKLSALFALMLITLNPEAWMYTNLYGNEPYIGFLVTLSWAIIVIGEENKKTRVINYFLSGSFLAVSQYMRSTALIIFLAFLFLLIIHKTKYRNLCVFVLGFLIFISPIGYFNYINLGLKSLAISQYSGISLYIGTNLNSNGGYYPEFFQELNDEIAAREKNHTLNYHQEIELLKAKSNLDATQLDSVIRNRIAGELALKRIFSNPTEVMKIGLKVKLPTFWAGVSGFSWSLKTASISNHFEKIEAYVELIAIIFHNLCILFGFFGLISLAFYGNTHQLGAISLYAFGAFFIGLLHTLVEVQGKYHYSIITIFPITASIFLSYLDNIRLNFWSLVKKCC